MFSVRLVVADHYMSPPITDLDASYSEFRGTEIKEVPVIRIFGSTVVGKKTCLHIHGVFPYIYIPYDGSEPHERLMYQIASSLDKALNISLGKANSAVQHVYKVVLISGLPFYGFHTKEHQYFKIYLYNPIMVKKATELLQSGAVLKRMFQAHEAHVPYILQFMIDYNLYGMNFVNLENVKFRRDAENPGYSENLSEELLLPESVSRMSTCEIEVDGLAKDITNRKTITDELELNPGLAAIWEDEKQRRREEGKTSQITPQSSQGRPFAASTDNEAFFKQKLHEKLLLLNSQISDTSSPLPNTPDITGTPYPAETPDNSGLVEASFLDVHVQSSGSGSFIRKEEMEQNDDTSFVDEDMVMSLSSSQREAGAVLDSDVFGSQDVVLAEILHGLDSSVAVDEDSVLGSQVPQELGNEAVHGSDDEDMQDLSQPLNLETADDSQSRNINRFVDNQNNSLWENTFWDNLNETIPQLDGTDDILAVPQRRRLGVRSRLSSKMLQKPAVNNSITTAVRSDAFLWTVDSAMKLCDGVTERKNSACGNSISLEENGVHNDQADYVESTSDSKNPAVVSNIDTEDENDVRRSSLMVVSNETNAVVAEGIEATSEDVPVTTDISAVVTKSDSCPIHTTDVETGTKIISDVETEDENDVRRSSLMVVSNETNAVVVEHIEASSEDVPVTTDISAVDTKSDSCPIHTTDVEASTEINLVKLDRLLLDPESDNDVTHGSVQSVSQSCLSSEHSSDALTVIREDPVCAVTSQVVGSECFKLDLADLPKISEGRTISNAVEDIPIEPKTNTCKHPLSEVSGASNLQGMKHTDSESGYIAVKGICIGSGPSHPTAESSNLAINFRPVSVVCCNADNLPCTSDNSVHDFELNTAGNRFEVNGQYCEQFRQTILIGDPSFTAQPSSSDTDNELQVNELFSKGNTSSTWLSSEQCSETSKSVYLSDIGTDLLTQYDGQPVQEISPVKNTSSCTTSRHRNIINQKQKHGRCIGLIRSRRLLTQQSKLVYVSYNKVEKPCVKCCPGKGFSSTTEITEQISKCHIRPKLSLNTDTEQKESSFPTVSEHPLDISPAEVKRIESILRKGNMDEIIELKDNSVNDDMSSVNEAENSKELLDSYVQKTWSKAKNRHGTNVDKDAVGKKRKEGIELSVGNRLERSAVTMQNQSILGKPVYQNNNTLIKRSTSPASRLPAAAAVHSYKYVGHSNGIHSEKLIRKLQKEKRKRLSLSYRRKTATQTSVERSKQNTNSIVSGELKTDNSTQTCMTSLKNVQCADRQKTFKGNNWAVGSVLKSGATQQQGSSQVINTVKVQEHTVMRTEFVDKDSDNNLRNNDYNRRLRRRGPVEGEVLSTECTSVQSVENMAECKLYSDPVRRLDRNGNSVPVVRLGNYRLRSSDSQRQKEFTTCGILLTPSGLSQKSNLKVSETVSCVHSSVKHPSTPCISGCQFPDLHQHLSKHANNTNRCVQESHVEHLSNSSNIPETVKPVDSKLKPKMHGQLKKACVYVQRLEDGRKNCLGSSIKSTVEPHSEFRLCTDIQFISDVNSHKGNIQNNKSENLHHMKSQRKVLKKNALCNVADTSIRHCYVKLVRLEDISQQIRNSPCGTKLKLKKNKFGAHSHGLKSNLLRCLSSKTCGNTNRISRSFRGRVVKREGRKILHGSNGSMKAEPCNTNTRQEGNRLFGSGHITQDSGKVTRSHSGLTTQDSRMVTNFNIKELSVSVPALDKMLSTIVCGDTATKTGGDIKHSENNILYVNMISKRSSINVTHGNVEAFVDCEKSDVCSVYGHVSTLQKKETQCDHIVPQSWGTTGSDALQKTEPCLEESGNPLRCAPGKSNSDCIQTEHQKHLRRKTGNGENHKRKKLLNNSPPYELNLFDKMRPLSICLERLDQSIIEKYSVSISSVTARTKRQNRTELSWQEMIDTGNNRVNVGSGGHWKDRGKLKHIHSDKIPCLDGVYDTSSSDDNSESINTDLIRQLEESPVRKKARCSEEIMGKVESNLPDQQHGNADFSNSSAWIQTPLKESHFGTSAQSSKWQNITSSYETCSTVQSPRKSLYLPLAIKIQKSPKKRNINTEDKFHERHPHKSDRSKPLKCTLVRRNRSSKKIHSSRLNGEVVKQTRPKHVAAKQKFTSDQTHQQPKGMCDILQKRKQKSSIPVNPSLCRQVAAELIVTPSSVCHDAVAKDYQKDVSAEEHICSSQASQGENVHTEDNCPIDMLHNSNVSSCEISDNLKSETTSIQIAFSFPLRTEAKMDGVRELCVSPQRSHGSDVQRVDVPIADGTECLSTEQRVEKWTESDVKNLVSKVVRKQTKTSLLEQHSENKPEVGARECDSNNMSQDSFNMSARKAETNKSNISCRIDFPERKKIVRERQNVDVFHTEELISCNALSATTGAVEGNLLHKSLTKPELPAINNESSNGSHTCQSNLCEGTESPKNCSSDKNASTVCLKNVGEVHQSTAEGGYSLSDDDEDDEGILSFYDATVFLSPAVHVQSKDSLVEPSVLDYNSTKNAVDLDCALLTPTEQDCSETVSETCMNVINRTSINEQSSKTGSCFRLTVTANENCKVYSPRFNPPSKDDILASLSEFCIPEYRHQDPFVSNVCDTGNRKEVGNKALKLCSTSVHDLQPFVRSSLNIVDMETWRRKWLQDHFSDINLDSIKPALAGHREVVIMPCKLPPSVTEVKLWYETTRKLTSKNLKEIAVDDKVFGRNIVIPFSPGQEPCSDDDMSLSPLTPRSSGFEGSAVGSMAAVHSTPQSTAPSDYLPSPSCTPIHNTKHKIAKILLKHSRKGLKLNSPNQENISSTLPFITEEPEETETANGAASDRPTTSCGSAPVCVCDPSELYKQQSNRDLSVAEPAQLADSSSSSQVPGEGQCVDNLQLHDHIPAMPMTWRAANSSCQIEESTPNNTYGFRMSFENLHDVKAICEHQCLTTFIMELHIQTRGDLRPDPAYDAIRGLFYTVVNDVPDTAGLSKHELGLIAVSNLDGGVKIPVLKDITHNCKITYVEDETSLVQELVNCVRKWDPDILGGYEVEMLSWGYLFHRAYTLQINLFPLLSRVPTSNMNNRHTDNENTAHNLTEEIKLIGRIVLSIWRLMRHEIALQSYSFESVTYHILHQRVPLHSFKHLTYWWEHRTHLYRWICVEYYLLRVHGIVKLLDQLDLIGRTSELARLFGIQFLEVLSRGSQFRVESMMLRLAKPLNYVPVSPSIQQRARMRAPESLPLIMEPHSRFYSDPVIVLDFQSLYPSIIIANNYCFSTCLGRVENLGQAAPFVFGCTQLRVPPAQLMKLENNINISPCGVAFVNATIRKGILPRMLQEILDTRLMVKQSMKRYKSNKTLKRVLHSRQLGLKLIANVTYGYTSANFSGRMPCIEVGDSVVSKARETLERAIHLVERTPRWGAQVVYGDTDSLFVLVPGKSREQAFKIGTEIAEAVTMDNPKPVKLKLEKIYQPCILQTKKRYVGYMYESPEQETPVYDAKGIETVRRDGCPAVAKILEKSLKLVFDTKDVSLVKNYVCRQFAKLLQGRLNIQDLIFAREYRGMSGYRPGACVPALELARRWLQTDKRAEPRQSERVPYVIVNGPPGLPLIRLVRSPHELLADPSLRPNATYYITKVIIPPLDRCFSLLGAEVESWYADMPRKFVTSLPTAMPCGLKKSTISQYFATMNCAVCNQLTNSGVCLSCQQQPERLAVVLGNKIRTWERTYSNITKVCQSCCGRSEAIDCASLDCPVTFRRCQSARDLQQAPFIQSLQDQFLTF